MNPSEEYCFDIEIQEILTCLSIPFVIYRHIGQQVDTLVVSQGFCDEYGFRELTDAYHSLHPDDRDRVKEAMERLAKHDVRCDIVCRAKTSKDDGYVLLHVFGKSIYPKIGVRLCLVWLVREGNNAALAYERVLDGTMERLSMNAKVRGSYCDYLTGLPNMAYFCGLAEEGRKRLQEQNIASAILFVGMMGLKDFNRRHGNGEGNRLICAVADILTRWFGRENCARFASGNFAALSREEGLEECLEEMMAACNSINNGKNLPIRIGIYPDQIEEVEVDVAWERARLAVENKQNRKESFYCFYDLAMLKEEKERQDIMEHLDEAIEKGWIKVHYQPIVRCANGKVCNIEALALWDDPKRGMLLPVSFVPALEEAMLIHKLDLCIAKQVLCDIKSMEKEGNMHVSVTINLSRIDFDSLDIVQAMCDLVDEAKVERKMIVIEITESGLGNDFDYMKEQIERFRRQGFQVWMDDFGGGYSSLEMLQNVKLDAIKFDMGFMMRMDAGNEARIILAQMMKLATSLGVDTVCEGVETKEQARFLREIGCSKLQGFYYMKPSLLDQIIERYARELPDGIEDPRQSAYYDTMGRVNLFDLSFLANRDDSVIKNTFDTVPMGVMEINEEGDRARYSRYNQFFREFVKRAFGFDLFDPNIEYPVPREGVGHGFIKAIEQCRSNGTDRAFIDEEMPDGTMVHSFVRKININPVTGSLAVAVAVLSITDPDEKTTYADIARSLAADYYNIYVIDLDTDEYIEYSSMVGKEELAIERHGVEFFASARRDALERIYEEDRESFLKRFSRDNVLQELAAQGGFTMTYRLIDTGMPKYVNMKATRMHRGNRIILGISDVDAQMKQQEEEKRLRQERVSLGRIAALSSSFIVLYTIDPSTGNYTQYNPSNEFASFGLARQGDDFFRDVRLDAPKAIDSRDMERHLRVLTKENMMREIQANHFFMHNYRLLLNGQSVPVSLKATLIEEDDGEKLLLGVLKDEKEEYRQGFAAAYDKARNNLIIFTHIAQALARGCIDLFYVNLESSEYIEYHTNDERGVLTQARQGNDFFASCKRDVKLYVHPDDQNMFIAAMDRECIAKALSQDKTFEMIYRRIKNDHSFYVRMSVSRIEEDKRYIVIAVSDIDELMRKRFAEERIQEERIIYARLHAITGNFICVYVIDPKTGSYREFSAIDNYKTYFSQEKEGEDFFAQLRKAARLFIHPDDVNRVLSLVTEMNVMAEIERSGIFTLGYRIMMDGKPIHCQLKAAMVEEKDGPCLIVGLNDIDAQVRQEEEYRRCLAQAQAQANIDALTGVRNRHSFLEAETAIDRQIAEGRPSPFAIAILDINDLKKVNDTVGHQAGDQYLKDAANIICSIFDQSFVFRIGGDEFAVIAQREEYMSIKDKAMELERHNLEALRTGGIVIACGISIFKDDTCVAQVFERADHFMYENKNALKSMRF